MIEAADNTQAAIFAEEALVVDVQIFLHNLMEEKGVSRAELAKAMGVSRARVTQILSDECRNLTVRSLARAAYALGEGVQFSPTPKEQVAPKPAALHGNVVSLWSKAKSFDEVEVPCSDDDGRLGAYLASSHERRMAA